MCFVVYLRPPVFTKRPGAEPRYSHTSWLQLVFRTLPTDLETDGNVAIRIGDPPAGYEEEEVLMP